MEKSGKVQLKFSGSNTQSSTQECANGAFHLFEVDEAFIDEIYEQDGPSFIKKCAAYPEEHTQAILCTDKQGYKLKVSETTNLLMVANLQKESAEQGTIIN